MNETVKDRLTSYLKYKGINNSEFGRTIGVSNAFISSMRKSIQPDKAEKISAAYPDLNMAWLLTGEGTMLKPITQSVGDIGGNASGVNVHGNGITINPNAYDALMEIVKANQQTTEKFQDITQKSQQQIDRLIALLEKLHGA